MRTKAIVFDFDGTLSKPNKMPNSWMRIWEKLDKLDEDKKFYEMYKNGVINYEEWGELVVKAYREYGCNKTLLKEVANDTELLDDTEQVIKELGEKGIKIFVLSGGIKNIIDYKLENVKEYVTNVEAQEILLDENECVESITKLNHLVEDKSEYVFYILNKYHLNPQEVLFVGNSDNDEDVYKTGVKTLCINPLEADYKNKVLWNNYIKKSNSLRDIMQFVEM